MKYLFGFIITSILLISCESENTSLRSECFENADMGIIQLNDQSISLTENLLTKSFVSFTDGYNQTIDYSLIVTESSSDDFEVAEFECEGEIKQITYSALSTTISAISKDGIAITTTISSRPELSDIDDSLISGDFISVTSSFSTNQESKNILQLNENGFSSLQSESFTTQSEITIAGKTFDEVYLNGSDIQNATLVYNNVYGVCALKNEEGIWLAMDKLF